jgi:pilus assembly protein FimV
MRMMEEEAVAREKSLAEANERVAQLEKNIKDMQRLLEIKGVVPPGGKPAAPPPANADQIAKADAAKAAAPAKAEPAKAEPAKADATKADAAKAAVEAPKPAVTAAVDPAKADQKGAPPGGEAPKAEPAKTNDAAKVATAPKPKPAAPPPPPAEPGLVDQIVTAITDPIYLAGGLGGLAVLGGGAFWMRRRRSDAASDAPRKVKAAPVLAQSAADASAAVAMAPMLTPVTASDDVDPLAEADLYLNFGRDAQAEEVLKEALQKNPQHSEAQLKLLQIYAARKDKPGFEKIATALNTQTSGTGDTWIKAAGMGYAFDPENPLYEAGKSAPAAEVPTAVVAGVAGTDLDFDLELAPGANPATTDVQLDSGEKTMMMQPGELSGMAEVFGDGTATQDITHDSVVGHALNTDAPTPEFTLNAPAAGAATAAPDFTVDAPSDVDTTKTSVTGDVPAGPMVSAIDFNFDEPKTAAAAAPGEFKHDSTVVLTPENQEKPAGLEMDFDIGGDAAPAAAPASGTSSVVPLDPEFMLDLGSDSTLVPGSDATAAAPVIPDIKLDDISLTLDDGPKAEAASPAAGGAKDDHWYDVQTKFDLAKAYQEMGDKDGAREILQEVIKEGDTAQQAEAKQLLDTLG